MIATTDLINNYFSRSNTQGLNGLCSMSPYAVLRSLLIPLSVGEKNSMALVLCLFALLLLSFCHFGRHFLLSVNIYIYMQETSARKIYFNMNQNPEQ